jgi:hypothetical protein
MSFTVIYKSKDNLKLHLLKNVLSEHNIIAVVLDKKDANYPFLGESELLVNLDDVETAYEILKDEIVND